MRETFPDSQPGCDPQPETDPASGLEPSTEGQPFPELPPMRLAIPPFGEPPTSTRDDRILAALAAIQTQLAQTDSRLAYLERRQAESQSRVEQLGYFLQQVADNLARSIESLRAADSGGDAEIRNLRQIFAAVAEPFDILSAIAGVLDPARDAATLAQFRAVLSGLSGSLDALGFERFRPEIGDRFDSQLMECTGYAAGPPGTVTAVESPGFRVRNMLVRPARVLIPDPRVLRSADPTA